MLVGEGALRYDNLTEDRGHKATIPRWFLEDPPMRFFMFKAMIGGLLKHSYLRGFDPLQSVKCCIFGF